MVIIRKKSWLEVSGMDGLNVSVCYIKPYGGHMEVQKYRASMRVGR